MRYTIAFALMASTTLTPAAASAQAEDIAVLREQIAAMQAEIARLAAQVEELEAEQANDAETISDLTARQAETSEQVAKVAADAPLIAWKGAPEFEGEGGWTFKPRGRLQIDAGMVSAPDSTGRPDGFGSEMRRARLGVEGTIPGGFGYKFEADFAANEVELTDAFLSYKDGPTTISIGQHNNFQSLDELTSSRFSSFIERAAFTDAFNFERRVGLSAQYASGPILAQAGVFTDNISDLPGKVWSADGRLVFAPKAGETQLHFGGSVHYAEVETGGLVRYRQRPLVHFTGERFINTGNLSAGSEFGLGLEAAAIAGRFHVAAEGYRQKVNRAGLLSDPAFKGGYAEAGVFLTSGDTRGYKGGIFDRVKPASPVGGGGFGALQFNVRYDYLDLNSGGILGGVQNGYHASLVWTPTDYTRFLLNYGKLDYSDAVYQQAPGDRSYSVDVIGVRAQVDF